MCGTGGSIERRVQRRCRGGVAARKSLFKGQIRKLEPAPNGRPDAFHRLRQAGWLPYTTVSSRLNRTGISCRTLVFPSAPLSTTVSAVPNARGSAPEENQTDLIR